MAPFPTTSSALFDSFLNFQVILNIAGKKKKSTTITPEGATLAAGFFFQADGLDCHGAIDRFAHVVDGKGRDADGGKGFHLDASSAYDAGHGFNAQELGRLEGKIDGNACQGEGMAERDEVAGFLGAHYSCQPGDLEHVALGQSPVANKLAGGSSHAHPATGRCLTFGFGFASDIDHAAGTMFVKVR
jgi:hypothetical protein